MVIRIVTIIATVEFLIMLLLGVVPLGVSIYSEAFIDLVLLALLSTPLIYVWVINPFVTARDEALSQIKHLAHTDSLTQLPNRRLLSIHLEKLIAGAVRHKIRGAALILDLDGFKDVNDTHGHDAGDEVLFEIAKRLRANTRSEDVAGRLGGDEFFILVQHLDGDERTARDTALWVAEKLVKGVRDAGGIWTMEDLAAYEVLERDPVRTMHQGYELITTPPPSSGGIAIAQMLNIIEPYRVSELDKVQRTHLVVEAMRRAYRDRALYLGDPAFYDVPHDMLMDANYAAGLRASIRYDKAMPSAMLPGRDSLPEGTDTTHYSLMDAEGNMVAATLTVNTSFGSKFMAPGTGIVLNNEMNDFSTKPGEPNAWGLIGFTANEIQPGKRMLSSMTPTFMFGEDRRAAIGTPGGSHIITMVLLGIMDFLEGNGPESWVSLPRYHHQYTPDRIYAEPNAFTAEEIEALEAMGHTVEVRNRTWGNMHGVLWDLEAGEVSAASDKRSDAGLAIVK